MGGGCSSHQSATAVGGGCTTSSLWVGGGSDAGLNYSHSSGGDVGNISAREHKFDLFLVSMYIVLTLLSIAVFCAHVAQMGLGPVWRHLPCLALPLLAFTCGFRVIGIFLSLYTGDIAEEFSIVGHLGTCLFYTSVWFIILGVYINFHPTYSQYNQGGVPWKWKYIAFGFNISLYILELSMALVATMITVSDSDKSESNAGADNDCTSPLSAVTATMNLVFCIGFVVITFVYFKVMSDCWVELVLRGYRKLVPFLVIVAFGCAYRSANDIVSAIFPYWIFSSTENYYSALQKEVIPGIALVVAEIILKNTIKKPNLGGELVDIESDPAFKQIDYSRLTDLKFIGNGAFGSVWSCIWTDERNKRRPVALKLMHHSSLSGDEMNELLRLGQLWHPNIINFYGHTKDSSGKTGIVLDLAQRGNLQRVLTKNILPWRIRFPMILDVAKGMEYIHGKRLLHRDLKPQNILVDENWHCKIADFGTSTTVDSEECTAFVGTPGYIAPECTGKQKYDQKFDVFSFAIVFWVVVMNGEFPYKQQLATQSSDTLSVNNVLIEFASSNVRPDVPNRLHPDLGELMQQCWAEDPVNRPSFRTVVKELKKHYATNFQKTLKRQKSGISMDVLHTQTDPESQLHLSQSDGSNNSSDSAVDPEIQQKKRKSYYNDNFDLTEPLIEPPRPPEEPPAPTMPTATTASTTTTATSTTADSSAAPGITAGLPIPPGKAQPQRNSRASSSASSLPPALMIAESFGADMEDDDVEDTLTGGVDDGGDGEEYTGHHRNQGRPTSLFGYTFH
ncbi:Serine/threonine-protein kinase HT1 [Pelomyxa schiedti]|nr:Serine/threonine-protein kinase HT1 [Pelomyxa schiedti]